MTNSRLAIAICALFLLAGTAAVLAVWGAYFTDSELERTGARAEAVVLKKEFLRSTDGDSDYLVSYRFSLPSGQPVVASRNVSKGLWSGLNAGSPITVVYAPDNPGRNFPLGHGITSLWAPVLVSLVFGGLAAFGGAVLGSLFLEWRRHRQVVASHGNSSQSRRRSP